MTAQRIALDVPVAVATAAFPEQLDMTRHRLERHDRTIVENALSQEIVVLADVGADIEDAVDAQFRQQLTEVESEVTLAHLAQWHDVIAERPADLEHRILDDLEHAVLRAAPNGRGAAFFRPISHESDHSVVHGLT